MGVNLHLDIEGWNAFANAGMKQIFHDDNAFPKIYKTDDFDIIDFRPTNFDFWRKSIAALNCNVEMWMSGLTALEADPTLWIECSY